mmetsp:Transcript_7447/g.6597  ORF Transcript_7447/g.6597 Transcript_7447/m.6597 type:complete len:169 (+) Transcript_7447:123-629(+)
MVKSKLLSEEEVAMQETNIEDTLDDLPNHTVIEEDPTMLKLNNVLKGRKRNKLNKTISHATGGKASRSKKSSRQKKSNVPSTKNAFNLRKKGDMPQFDDDQSEKNNIRNSQEKDDSDQEFEYGTKRKRDSDEESIKNISSKEPIYNSNTKPFGNKLSKPAFGKKNKPF